MSPKLLEAIEGLALQKPPFPIATLYRQICRIAQDRGENVPNYKAVYRVVRELPKDLVMLAHEGTKAYTNIYDLIHRREAERPNEVWQADHCLLDILLILEDGHLSKPWLTVILDDYSRAVAGYFLSFDSPCILHTSLALRQAIWRKDDPRWHVCGVPEVLYTDNGSDFRSHHLEQVGADLKMQLVFSTPGAPRGRGRIERFFGTLTKMFLSSLPGYKSPAGGIRGKASMTLVEFDGLLRTFALDVYHRHENSKTNISPAERWEKGGFLPRMPDSLEQLDLLLLTVPKARIVRPDGIHFQGLRYVDTTLAAYVGEQVELCYDPRDLAEIRVFHKEHFLCRAICPELAGVTIPLQDILRARNQRRRQLRTIIRDRKKTVEELLDLKKGSSKTATVENTEPHQEERPNQKLKRYFNE